MNGSSTTSAGHRSAPARRRGAIAAALGALALPRAVAAQTQTELATRRMLIEQATAERTAGHHAQALALAQRAGAVRMSPSVRLFIAQEMDATGDPAGALAMAGECVREVERDRVVPHRAALLRTCRELQSSTPSRVGYLVVRAPAPAPDGLRVTVRGAVLNPALLGVPHVVSPGAFAIEASAPGRVAFSASLAVDVGATVAVDLDLPAEPVAPPAIVPPPVTIIPPVVAAPRPTPLVATPPARSPSRLAPGLLLGSGAAAVAGGVVLLVVRAGALDGCTVTGGAAVCDTPSQLDAARSANGLAVGGGVLLGVGAAALATGVGWLLLDRGATARPAPGTVGVVPMAGGLTVGLTGRFP
jgi:hypothetical protein